MASMEMPVVIVGGLLLERAPKSILMTDEMLESYYDGAVQEFKDFCQVEWKTVFEPPNNFKTMVMDHVRYYLDMKRMRFGI